MAAPWARCRVVCTGQHRELVRPILDFFEIHADVSLDGLRPEQPLATRARRLTGSLQGVLASERPDLVLAQGDTTSVLATAWASFFQRFLSAMSRPACAAATPFLPFPRKPTGSP